MKQSLESIVFELDVRIEAGSIRKPNRERDIANVNSAVQVWQPILVQYGQLTGDFQPINHLSKLWAKAYDMDAKGFQLQPPPPPQPDQAAMQEKQLELEFMQQEHQQGLAHRQEEHEQKMTQRAEESRAKAEAGVIQAVGRIEATEQMSESKLLAELKKHAQNLGNAQESHDQELRQDEERHRQELRQLAQQGVLQRELARAASAARPSSAQSA